MNYTTENYKAYVTVAPISKKDQEWHTDQDWDVHIPKISQVCMVCGKRIRRAVVCPNCGYDRSREYEDQMTLTKELEVIESVVKRREKYVQGMIEPIKESLSKLQKEHQDEIRVLKASLQLTAGEIIQMGTYPQMDDGIRNPIEWKVLELTDEKALIQSVYILNGKAYNEKDTKVTWENCTLREWLNEDFYENAFTEEEKSIILSEKVKTVGNPNYATHSGPDTEDKIFVLSLGEAIKYYQKDDKRKCESTPYALKMGIGTNKGYSSWWLRTPGVSEDRTTCVDTRGVVYLVGMNVSENGIGVRPALWINLNNS